MVTRAVADATLVGWLRTRVETLNDQVHALESRTLSD